MKRVNFNEIRNNNLISVLLFFLFLGLIAGLGLIIGLVWGNIWFGVIVALVFGLAYALIAYYAGAKMIMSLSNAKPVTKKDEPYLYHTVEGLALAAGIPTPKAYVIEDESINAFATGRNPANASVAVTRGLLNKLNRQEIEGVMAHEISHIRNYDVRSMMIAAVMVGVVILLSDLLLRSFIYGGGRSRDNKGSGILIIVGLVLAILAPFIGDLIKLAISRKKEYAADAGAAVLTRYPPGIASALKKIKDDKVELKTSNKAFAHLYISPPKKKSWFSGLFSTHPPIDERIKRLEQM